MKIIKYLSIQLPFLCNFMYNVQSNMSIDKYKEPVTEMYEGGKNNSKSYETDNLTAGKAVQNVKRALNYGLGQTLRTSTKFLVNSVIITQIKHIINLKYSLNKIFKIYIIPIGFNINIKLILIIDC